MENNNRIVNYILLFLASVFFIIILLFTLFSRKTNKKQVVNPIPSPSFFQPTHFLPQKNTSPSIKNSPPPQISAAPFTGVKEEPIDPQLEKKGEEILDLIKKTPIVLDDFIINYDFQNETVIVSPKKDNQPISEEDKQKIKDWFKNHYPNIPQDKIIIVNTLYSTPTPIPHSEMITPVFLNPTPSSFPQTDDQGIEVIKALFEILDVFTHWEISITPSFSSNSSSDNPSNTSMPLPPLNYQPPKTQYPYVYYPQAGGPFDDYPLPGGCNIKKAGCGPTTVAMIIASYKDKSIDPRHIVNEYGQRVGCDGSSYLTAIEVLRNHGIKVGELIKFSSAKAEEAGPVFKKFIDAGKTLFVLTNFCNSGCGHFFWVIDVDKNNNIWAFDPYYGRYQIPYNENSRYPFPLYRYAFSVSP